MKRILIVIFVVLAITSGYSATKSSVPQISGTPNSYQIAESAMPNSPAVQAPNVLLPVNASGKFGYLDTTGKYIVQPKYDMGLDFNDGLALVMLGGKWGFIDSTGKEVIPLIYKNQPTEFKNGYARLLDNNGKLMYINTLGKIIWQAK